MQQKIFFICLFFISFFCKSIAAQEHLRTISTVNYIISASSIDDLSSESQIVRALALNNGVSLSQAQIKLEANVFASIVMDSNIGQYTLVTKILNKHLSGMTRFRAFEIDSLLMPPKVLGNIFLLEGIDTLVHFPIQLRTYPDNKTTIELPNDLWLTPDSLAVALQFKEVSYKGWKWAFDEVTDLINLYYAYSEILKQLITEYGAMSLNRKQGTVDILLAWHQISRVNAYIEQHRFVEKLHLDKNDPQEFLDSYALSKRMETRAATLFRQLLKAKKTSSLSDKKKYCEAYMRLSLNYFQKADGLQPYLAEGFEEVAEIFPSISEKKMLQKSARFFDVFNRVDTASTPQLIYNHIVNSAQQEFDKEKFVRSMQLLKNAALLEEWFDEVIVSDNYSILYQQSLEGVMSSYLKVSVNAYRLRKYQMAERYYQKAMTVYKEFGSLSIEDSLGFLQFTEQQIELATEMLLNNEYRKAFALLELTRKIRGCEMVYQDCPAIDSLLLQALQMIWAEEIDLIDESLDDRKFDEAKIALDSVYQFTIEYQDYFKPFPEQEVVSRANILFDAYFSHGEKLLQSHFPEKALDCFLQAQKVEQQYLPDENTHLKILVYNATVPVILNEIEKAGFETWANRMVEADSIYRRAKQMQVDYQQENNPELQEAFSALEIKMEQRKCVSLGFHLNHLNNLIEKRIESQNYELAEENLKEALAILAAPGICTFDASETAGLEKKYTALLHYKHQIRDVEKAVFQLEYDSAVARFVSLSDYYLLQKFKNQEIEKLELYSWIKSKNVTALTSSAVSYFIERNNFLEAFRYLNLLKIQGVTSQDTKELQVQIGNGIGLMELNNPESSSMQNLNANDKWFRYFRLSRFAVSKW